MPHAQSPDAGAAAHSSISVAYKPHMTSMQAHAVVCDVPEVLWGVELAGIEVRRSDGVHAPPPDTVGYYIDKAQYGVHTTALCERVARHLMDAQE